MDHAAKTELMARFMAAPISQKMPEEKLVFSKLLDQVSLCAREYSPAFSDFLDPMRADFYADMIAGGARGVQIVAYGGSAPCERVILGFTPEDIPLAPEMFPIGTLKVAFPGKSPAHSDILGSILGLGLTRSVVGDIFIGNGEAYVFVSADISDFVASALDKVGNVSVRTAKAAELPDLPENTGTERSILVASPRFDAVLAQAFKLSRSKAASLIAAKKAFVNWRVIQNASKDVKLGDMLTLRGFGRVKINEFGGQSKKGRKYIKVTVWGHRRGGY